VQDVYDVDALQQLMSDLARRTVTMVSVTTQSASPFARSLLMGYIAQFLYEGDSPLAERRAAALSLDPALLAELLGRGEGAQLRDLLDPQVVADTAEQLQRLSADRACRDADDVTDLLRTLGPLTTEEIVARTQDDVGGHVPGWLNELAERRLLIEVRVAGEGRWADAQDAARLRDALGVALPVGVPAVFTEPVPDPLGDLVTRYARTHTPFTLDELSTRLGVGRAVAGEAVRRLVDAGRVVQGALRPLTGETVAGHGDDADDLCDADVLRMLRRRSLAALRQEVEPVTQDTFARFLVGWQSVGELRGVDGVHRAVEQLAGVQLPASALESLVLPARVRDYSPAMLDELMTAGEVLWQGHASLPGDDGWVSLHLADSAHLSLAAPNGSTVDEEVGTEHAQRVLQVLEHGGAYFFRALADAVSAQAPLDDATVLATMWQLVWQGRLTGDTLAPVRMLLAGGRSAHKSRRSGPRPGRTTRWSRAPAGLTTGTPRPDRATMPRRSGPATAAGRWSLLPEPEPDTTLRGLAVAEQLLDRYGVVTRGSVMAEGIEGGYAGVYRILASAEEAGRVRRGYFVEHLGAAQFGTTGAVDRMRAMSESAERDRRDTEPARVLVLAATDPANPYGASVPWPAQESEPSASSDGTPSGEAGPATGHHRPGRKAGALVVLAEGTLALYLERGGRTALSFTGDPATLTAAAGALADQVRHRGVAALTVAKIDGEPALSSDHPLARALTEAGFHTAPQGLRMRR
jgi:ATP-dependent Lhr-like helicase